MVISGFRLWQSASPLITLETFLAKVPVERELYSIRVIGKTQLAGSTPAHSEYMSLVRFKTGDQIATLDASPGSNEDQVATIIEGDTIKSFAGQCLGIHLQTRDKPWYWPWANPSVNADLFLPFWVPSSFKTRIGLMADVSYKCPDSVQVAGPSENFYFNNPRCQNDSTQSDEKAENIPNCKIVAVANGVATDLNTRCLNFTQGHIEKTITAAGHMDEADCSAIGASKYHDAICNFIVTSTMQCDSDKKFDLSLGSDSDVPLVENGQTQVCATLKKACTYNSSDVDYEIYVKFDGDPADQPTRVLFKSSRGTLGADGGQLPTGNVSGFIIKGTYSPGFAADDLQVCGSVTPPGCAF